jgi:hypothetical protein
MLPALLGLMCHVAAARDNDAAYAGGPRYGAEVSSVRAAELRVPWDDSPSWSRSAPTLFHAARQLRRQGLPLLHLWQSQHFQLALGLNSRGRPGIYLTQKMAD